MRLIPGRQARYCEAHISLAFFGLQTSSSRHGSAVRPRESGVTKRPEKALMIKT